MNKRNINKKTRQIQDRLLKNLCKICPTKTNQSLRNYCTIKIGGIGKYICFPKTIRQTKKLVNFLVKKKIKYFMLGNGSNIVFEDSGYSGVLICLKNLNKIYFKQTFVTAYSGANLFALNNFCMQNCLSGIEFCYGIPGTVGGAVFMNAGAYGGQIADILDCVWVLHNGRVKKIKASKLYFGYRHSIFMKNQKFHNAIILKARFKLKIQDKEKIKEKQKEIFSKRLLSQPYGTKNAGSTFKKVGEIGAGKIIDKMGLKGVTIGYMQISPKHANFFVNLDKATSKDFHQLIDYVKQQATKRFGEDLQEEIIFVGD